MLILRITSMGRTFDFPLPPSGRLNVGRGEGCHVLLDDPSVSRLHFRLETQGERVTVTDENSRWGTFINGERVLSGPLRVGDEIRLGESFLRLQTSDTEISESAPPSVSASSRESLAGLQTQESFQLRDQMPIEQFCDQPQESAKIARLNPQQFIGAQFHRFQLKSMLHESATGLSFRTVDDVFGDVVLKIIQPSCVQNARVRVTFLNAVNTMRRLRHPTLVSLYGGGIREGLCFTVSEFFESTSLSQVIHKQGVAGMLDWRKVVSIGLQILSAYEFAERHQIFHQNLTPDHVLISQQDQLVRINGMLVSASLASMTTPGTDRNAPDQMIYRSPEQLTGQAARNLKTDLYQLGVIMYQLLSGRSPFSGQSAQQLLREIHSTTPARPSVFQLSVPALLEDFVLQLISPVAERRGGSAASVRGELERIQQFLGA